MRQSIRALGWCITLSMLILFAFLASAVGSMIQVIVVNQGIRLGNPEIEVVNGTMRISFPILINNTGQYDISDLNITTVVRDGEDSVISRGTTIIERVGRGKLAIKLHNVTLDLADLISRMTNLLFEDAEFKVDTFLGLRYAYALSFSVGMMNQTFYWGAPFSGFSITRIAYHFNLTHHILTIDYGFENHSPIGVTGLLTIRLYNDRGEYLGQGSRVINAPHQSSFSDSIWVIIEKPERFTMSGYIEMSIENPIFGHVEVGRFPYG